MNSLQEGPQNQQQINNQLLSQVENNTQSINLEKKEQYGSAQAQPIIPLLQWLSVWKQILTRNKFFPHNFARPWYMH